ncbi:MAG: redox-regulated ATPase YchF [Bacteroidia bacterium]|nr:redox-regulated ATPase YchF [Bacteroidia bacterium]
MKCGIVGLPNVGKSTLFNSLSNAKAESANYPFCTIEANLGVVPVPDPRMEELARLVNPKRIVPAVVNIVDIAGLVKGASKGEGRGNAFLNDIRECEALIHVLRCFEDPNVVHVENSVDPVRDKEIIDLELVLKDLEWVQRRLDKTRSMTKGGNKEALRQVAVLEKIVAEMEEGVCFRALDLTDAEKELVADLGLLTGKPVLYVCNVDEASVVDGNAHVERVKAAIKDEKAELLVICAAFEAELTEIEEYDDRQEFLEAVGLKEPSLNILIRTAYRLLNLETYFTAGEKELRAWTISKGTRAPQAAGVIHTDFERGFIRAEVIKYADYLKYKTEAAVKEAGKMGVEGKEYVVEDGDVMHFRFNV